MPRLLPIILLSFAILFSCSSQYRTQSLQYTGYRITAEIGPDPTVNNLIQPYRDSVNASMNAIVGHAELPMDKKMPESMLGNFMADAFLSMAKEKYNTHVDISLMNYGGIRLTQLPAGPVTRGKIFELMPFDNLVVLQRMKGSDLQVLLDLMASRGGWPIAGMRMQIKDKKAVNVTIGGQPLDPSKIYVVANSDFLANGGDELDVLRTIPQENKGYLMRDALFDYIEKLKREGKNIGATIENRVTNAE